MGRPATISRKIAFGSSLRGLSDVSTTSSAKAAATAAIFGRFPLSRSPPAPNTTHRFPRHKGLTVSNAARTASSVCAKSTSTEISLPLGILSIRPGTTGARPIAPATTSAERPPNIPALAAASAFNTLNRPHQGKLAGTSPSGVHKIKVLPPNPIFRSRVCTSPLSTP